MRILLHDFGGYPFIVQLARFLARKGHEIDFVCAENSLGLGAAGADASNTGFSIFKVPGAVEKGTTIRRALREAAFGRAVAGEITRYRPEIVVSANAPLEAQRKVLKACRRNSIPFVYWLQDLHGPAIRSILKAKLGFLGAVVGRYYARVENSMLHKSDGIIAISEGFSAYLESHGVERGKVHFLPNWAPLEETPRLSKENPWAAKHGLTDKIVLMYSGTLGYKHDTRLFIDLARKFEKDADVTFVVVSSGKKADDLAEFAKAHRLNNLIVLPRQPYVDLPSVLASADVLFSVLEPQASSYSIPSKVLTYLCAGRPILLMMPEDNPSARIVRDARAGVVVAPENRDGLFEAARSLLEHGAQAQEFGDNARKYAEQTFDIASIAAKFETILGTCLNQ